MTLLLNKLLCWVPVTVVVVEGKIELHVGDQALKVTSAEAEEIGKALMEAGRQAQEEQDHGKERR